MQNTSKVDFVPQIFKMLRNDIGPGLSTLQVRKKGDLHGPKLFQASNEGIEFLSPEGGLGACSPPKKTLKMKYLRVAV